MNNEDWKREFQQFDESGWPLCPRCGKDELWSDYNPYDERGNTVRPKSVEASILGGRVRCYVCSFERQPSSPPQTPSSEWILSPAITINSLKAGPAMQERSDMSDFTR